MDTHAITHLSMEFRSRKLIALMKDQGHPDHDDVTGFLAPFVMDSVVPGICMNEGCDYTTDCEPDATANWCECCDANSVCSALTLGLSL